MHLEITAHTSDGDQKHIVCGDIEKGRIEVHASILKDYPDATFDEQTIEG